MSKPEMRVVSFSHEDYSGYQLLQRKGLFGWKTIDREDVPAHVKISLATVGDAGGWVSKFASFGSFGRDGRFTPFTDRNGDYERTPRLLTMFGKQAFRKYVRMVNVGGDFSYWVYSDHPSDTAGAVTA